MRDFVERAWSQGQEGTDDRRPHHRFMCSDHVLALCLTVSFALFRRGRGEEESDHRQCKVYCFGVEGQHGMCLSNRPDFSFSSSPDWLCVRACECVRE